MIGPKDLSALVGEPRSLSPYLLAQDYEDGTVYSVQVKRGCPLATVLASQQLIPKEDASKAICMAMVDEIDEEYLFLAFWVEDN